jgi:hypothetical protein
MQEPAGFIVGGLLAFDGQQVFLDLDAEFGGLEPGDRDLDAVFVLGGALDIVGRIALGASKPTTER